MKSKNSYPNQKMMVSRGKEWFNYKLLKRLISSDECEEVNYYNFSRNLNKEYINNKECKCYAGT